MWICFSGKYHKGMYIKQNIIAGNILKIIWRASERARWPFSAELIDGLRPSTDISQNVQQRQHNPLRKKEILTKHMTPVR